MVKSNGGNEKIAEFDFVATRCPIFLFVFRRVVEPSLLGGKKYVHLSTVQWPLHAVEQTQEKRKQEFCSSILLCFFFFSFLFFSTSFNKLLSLVLLEH